MRGATEKGNNKPQVKAKFYALDRLPIDTEADIVEEMFSTMCYHALEKSIGAKRQRIVLIVEGLAQSVLRQTSHHALRWDGRLIESQEGLETKVCLRADLIQTLSVEPTVALHVLLNSGVEAALMCLDSLRHPSSARTPYVGSSISVVKATKENAFL
ncbi:hypothetical protein M9H77_22711 [Catharanthus roseus]|uniref:Uncharacterized protein n=1 Tax=Catharanthus roseus TaxID=4058 RepID=A0ACC0AQY3_CATRO|nr:hypothetical protein M9H77_22711 [Catharanthus roseus]